MKKFMPLLLSLSLLALQSSALGVNVYASTDDAETTVRIGALSGPTAMGLVKLMDDAENGETENTYEFAELSTDPSTFAAPLATGEIDIAAVPSNLSSVIYNNTDGGIQVLAINNLGVLDIVERGADDISSISDLAGKTIYATGEGATPEYTLRYLLSAEGLDPDQDLTIQWCSDTTEALSYINEDEEAIAMLPQPFVTAALAQVEDLHIAIDLNDAWAETDADCEIVTGVLVVRTEFAEEHPDLVETFLTEYAASMDYASENTADNAALIEKYGIVAKAAIAEKALPNCHLQMETGADMFSSLSGYLNILYEENPASIGGNLPGEDFYYGI
jgi:NitT/TauT family transport system substrate-binding protein